MTKIALVSCARSQTRIASPAEDLYTSPLFRAARQFAERFTDDWFILSAAYGLVHHTQVIAPYERNLNALSRAERHAWVAGIIQQSSTVLSAGTDIILLTGTHDAKALIESLIARGHSVQLPLGRLGIGQRIQWLRQQSTSGPSEFQPIASTGSG